MKGILKILNYQKNKAFLKCDVMVKIIVNLQYLKVIAVNLRALLSSSKLSGI